MIEVAFYKARGNWQDKTIRWFTSSLYSHCEIIMGGMQLSSSIMEGGVRNKEHIRNTEKWDYVTVTGRLDSNRIINLFSSENGCGYDFKGILLSEIFPFEIHSKTKWYCSEICAEALRVAGCTELIGHPSTMSPQKLYERLNVFRNQEIIQPPKDN